MAITKNPLLTGSRVGKGVSEKQFIVKKINGTIFLTKYPDMSKVVPSAAQLREKSRFAQAVAYAQEIINDPIRKTTYKKRPGSNVYHSAIKDYMEGIQR